MPSFGVSFGSGDNDEGSGNSRNPNGSVNLFQLSPTLKALFAVGVGVVFLLIGVFTFLGQSKPDSKPATVYGVVVAVERGQSPFVIGDKVEQYCQPTVEYTVDNVTYVVSDVKDKSKESSFRCSWLEGQSVPVRYDPADPAGSTLTVKPSTFGAIIFGGVGAVLFIGGIMQYFRSR